MINELRRVFAAEIENEVRRISDTLTSGSVPDYPNYKRLVGEISGLQRSVELMKAAFKNFLDEEDD